jgi:hypothetical protein
LQTNNKRIENQIKSNKYLIILELYPGILLRKKTVQDYTCNSRVYAWLVAIIIIQLDMVWPLYKFKFSQAEKKN